MGSMILSFPYRGGLSWPLRLVRLAGLVVLILSLLPDPSWSPWQTGLLTAVSVGWLLWLFADWLTMPWQTAVLLLIGLAGGVLTGLSPHGVAIAFPAVALLDAATRLRTRYSLPITAAVVASTVAFDSWDRVLEHGLILLAAALVGALRWQHLQRVEQADLLQTQVQRAAVLAERTRIARELHDVQAHALAALSVQLKVIDALVEDGASANRIREFVNRAEQLTREGLIETRRAILALRGEVLPIDDLLDSLAKVYTDRDGNNASLVVTGSHATLPTETTMVLYRAAQEALTNIRKHAGNSPVTVKLDYAGNAVSLTVLNELIPHESDLASVGAGYGLPGLRERVDAVDGTLTAGPKGGIWELGVRIPIW